MYLWHLWASSLAIFYSVTCLLWTLMVRFIMQAYFSSVHAAAIGLFIGLMLWLECASPKLLNRILPICSVPPWEHKRRSQCIGLVMTLILLFLLLLNASFFTALALAESNFDFDRFIAAVFYWGGAFLVLFKLFIIHRRQREKRTSRLGHMHTRDRATAVIGMHLHLVWDDEIHEHRPSTAGLYVFKDHRKHRRDLLMRYGLTTLLALSFVLYTLVMFGVTINEAWITHDRRLFPTRNDTFILRQAGHRQHRVHMLCVGKGNVTLLIENSIARPALLAFPFLPEVLASYRKYRTCVYDRRGYGWSDGLEFDWFALFMQGGAIDHDVVPALFGKLIKPPAIYVGHGYGAQLVINRAIATPKLFKGAVLIDWFSFANRTPAARKRLDTTLESYFMWSNFLPTGWLRVFWTLKGWSLRSLLNYDFKEVPPQLTEEVKTSIMQGHTLEAAMQEGKRWLSFNKSLWSERLKAVNRQVPLLVLDRQFLGENKKPKCHYRCSLLHSAASTDDVMYTMKGTTEVAERIDEFVREIGVS